MRCFAVVAVALLVGCDPGNAGGGGGGGSGACGGDRQPCCNRTACNSGLSCINSVCQSGSSGVSSPVGRWSETVNGAFITNVVYSADGTAAYDNGGTGTWAYSAPTLTVHGMASSGGTFIDTLTMSADGNTLTGINGGGLAIVEKRLATVTNGCGISLSGLTAYYPLDSDFSDHYGTHPATASAVTFGPGRVGNGGVFDGSTSQLALSGSDLLTGARTLCAWVRLTGRTGPGYPVFVGGVSGQGDFFGIQSTSPTGTCSGTPLTPYVDHWNTPCYETSAPTVTTATWTFACWAGDATGTLTMWINGVSSSVGNARLFSYPFSSVTVGANTIAGTTTAVSLFGSIDEVSVWSRILTTAEVQAMYASGTGCRLAQ